MIKVLIVEDEYLVRVGLRSSIPWQENGLVLLDDAVDGCDAYEKIKEQRPDIMLLDMRMPKLSGDRLLIKLKDEGIEICTIVLSCCDDFGNVRTALQYGALDYIQKASLKSSELLVILEKAKEKILKSRIDVTDQEQKLLDCEILLNYVNQGGNPPAEAKGHFLYFDIYSQATQSFRSQGSLPADICRQALKNLGIQSAAAMLQNTLVVVCVLNRQDVAVAAKKLQTQLESALDCVCTICIIGQFEDLAHAQKCFSPQAVKNLFFYIQRGSFFSEPQLPEFAEECEFALEAAEKRIAHGIEIVSANEINASFADFAKYFSDRANISCTLVQHHALALCNMLLSDTQFDAVSRAKLQAAILKADNLADIKTIFSTITKDYFERVQNVPDSGYSQAIQKALEYIRENKHLYISLADVSRHVNLSEPYLSGLFKKETGKTLVNYVKESKIEIAKKMLKEQLLVYEVADRLGYQNSNYFAKIFKNATGISPEKYREKFKRSH